MWEAHGFWRSSRRQRQLDANPRVLQAHHRAFGPPRALSADLGQSRLISKISADLGLSRCCRRSTGRAAPASRVRQGSAWEAAGRSSRAGFPDPASRRCSRRRGRRSRHQSVREVPRSQARASPRGSAKRANISSWDRVRPSPRDARSPCCKPSQGWARRREAIRTVVYMYRPYMHPCGVSVCPECALVLTHFGKRRKEGRLIRRSV